MSNVAGSSNGRTPAFGAGYLGSSPSPAVRQFLYNTCCIRICLGLLAGTRKTEPRPVNGDEAASRGREIF